MLSKTREFCLAVVAIVAALGVILLTPREVLAWGPVTHVVLGLRVLATVVQPIPSLAGLLLSFPEAFLYGSLAPDIVQGRRLQSRLRRHSHNWDVGLGLLSRAEEAPIEAFAMGYLAHLAADVVAHNFFLPARLVGCFEHRFSGHIYHEARFDSLHSGDDSQLVVRLLGLDLRVFDAVLRDAIDSPLMPFAAHRRIFEGGLRRLAEWNRAMKALGGPMGRDVEESGLLCGASCQAIATVLREPEKSAARLLDPMGAQAIKSAALMRRNLQRMARLGDVGRSSAREMANAMCREIMRHLKELPFG